MGTGREQKGISLFSFFPRRRGYGKPHAKNEKKQKRTVSTDLAVEIEDTPAVVYRDCGGSVQPGTETTYPRVEEEQVPTEEEEELNEVEADDRMPEEAGHTLYGLMKGRKTGSARACS